MSTNKKLNLSKKLIYSITPFTTLDYKDHLSCIVWFIACNMRCQYCYNIDIVTSRGGKFTLKALFDFLHKRRKLLDGVVLSGGESTLHQLYEICTKIKEMNFDIKIDTNGSNPRLIKKLIDCSLVDYIALDFKSTKSKYQIITNSNLYDKFLETLKYLIKKDFDFEVRTTIHEDLLNEDDLNQMIKTLIDFGYKKEFYIQNFLEVDNLANLKKSQNSIDKNRLNKDLKIVWRN